MLNLQIEIDNIEYRANSIHVYPIIRLPTIIVPRQPGPIPLAPPGPFGPVPEDVKKPPPLEHD